MPPADASSLRSARSHMGEVADAEGWGHLAKANPRLRPLHLVVRETEFCGLRLAGYFRRRMRENSRNSVRRPRCASLTRRNYGGFCLPGNRPGLSGLHGGGCRDRTDGHRSLASLQNDSKIGRTNVSPPLTSASLAGPYRFEITANDVALPGDVLRVPVFLAVEEVTKHACGEVAEATTTDIRPAFAHLREAFGEDMPAIRPHPFAVA